MKEHLVAVESERPHQPLGIQHFDEYLLGKVTEGAVVSEHSIIRKA
jgi:hypothetical protein